MKYNIPITCIFTTLYAMDASHLKGDISPTTQSSQTDVSPPWLQDPTQFKGVYDSIKFKQYVNWVVKKNPWGIDLSEYDFQKTKKNSIFFWVEKNDTKKLTNVCATISNFPKRFGKDLHNKVKEICPGQPNDSYALQNNGAPSQSKDPRFTCLPENFRNLVDFIKIFADKKLFDNETALFQLLVNHFQFRELSSQLPPLPSRLPLLVAHQSQQPLTSLPTHQGTPSLTPIPVRYINLKETQNITDKILSELKPFDSEDSVFSNLRLVTDALEKLSNIEERETITWKIIVSIQHNLLQSTQNEEKLKFLGSLAKYFKTPSHPFYEEAINLRIAIDLMLGKQKYSQDIFTTNRPWEQQVREYILKKPKAALFKAYIHYLWKVKNLKELPDYFSGLTPDSRSIVDLIEAMANERQKVEILHEEKTSLEHKVQQLTNLLAKRKRQEKGNFESLDDQETEDEEENVSKKPRNNNDEDSSDQISLEEATNENELVIDESEEEDDKKNND